jgi:hypothetical protein
MYWADNILYMPAPAKHLRLAMPTHIRNQLRSAMMSNKQLAGLLPSQRNVITVVRDERGVPGIAGAVRKQFPALTLENLRIKIPRNRQADGRLGTCLSRYGCL